MASFFEKLKKGMGIEVSSEEKVEEKKLPKEKKATLEQAKRIEIKSEEKKIPKKEEENENPPAGGTKEGLFEAEGELAVDVYQTEEDIVIQSTIAGLKPENLEISIENDVVTIRGVREKPGEKSERDYFYQECYWGAFSREIILPAETDPNRVTAEMKEGILTVRIPKIQKEKKRRILVRG